MKASTCSKSSAAMRQKEGRDKEIANGNFVAALGYKVTVTICFEPPLRKERGAPKRKR